MEKYHTKEKRSKDANQQKHLPHDLILQHILPCLPIKYLIQSKLLCKDMYSSISCSKFILNHYHKSVFSHPFTPLKCLIIQSGYRNYYLYKPQDDRDLDRPEVCSGNNNNNPVCPIEVGSRKVCSGNNNNNPVCPIEVELGKVCGGKNLVKLKVDFDADVNEKISLVGTSNGLVCLGETYGVYFILWNPFTNEYQKYYTHDFQLITSSSYRQFVNWGFGYASSLNDHKVVRIMRCWNGEFITVHVFSLRSNAWKIVEFCYDDCFLQHGRARLVGETLYWTICNFDGSKKVVGFDLVLERFSVFPSLVISSMNDRLCVMGGCLAKYDSKTRNGLIMDIVKCEGRMVSVRFGCNLMNLLDFDDLVGFTNTGKVFVMYNYLRMLYLVDANSKELIITFKDRDGISSIDSYVPSQVSPYPSV